MAQGGAAAFDEGPRPYPPFLIRPPRAIRDLKGLPSVLGRSGALELRLATTKREIRKLQRLRFKIFYEQGSATAPAADTACRRDRCPFDRICDHLLVVDTAAPDGAGGLKRKVVGTYRLLRSDMIGRQGFYSGTEFDLAPLLSRHRDKHFLELGRSCVHPAYRSKRAIDLLWHGIGIYAAHHGIDVLIGCSSLPGTALDALAVPLSYAFHYAAAPPAWQVRAVASRAARMDRLDKACIDPRRAMAGLPPLIKAYVRTGGTFASQAVVDHRFGTTDLFTVLPLVHANARYLAHFGGTPASQPQHPPAAPL